MRKISVMFVLVLALLSAAVPAWAGSSVSGVTYRVNITMPAGHDHIYLYDQPSSSNGNNLGRIDNGEYVTGISSVVRNGYTWILCNYNGIEGYIRKNNLVEVSGGSGSGNVSKSSGSTSYGNTSSGSSQSVSFSGEVNVRTGPGLNYDVIGSVSQGQTLSYAGETHYDSRGVAWYSVKYSSRTGWVSSKYSHLKGSSASGNSNSKSNSNNSKTIELKNYYGKNIRSIARLLGDGFTVIPESGEDNVYVTYKKNGLEMTGDINSNIGIISIYSGTQYSLVGITIGMSKSDAQAILNKYPRRYPGSVEYVVEGTSNAWEAMLYVGFTGGVVSEISYGIWS